MKILILGADGYLGWPTAMSLSMKGHNVSLVDDFSKRKIELEEGIYPLENIPTLQKRVRTWKKVTGKNMDLHVCSLLNHRKVYSVFKEIKPDAVIHYAEQPSAPYSMQGREQAVFTQNNNVIGNLNVLFAIKKYCPEAHLIKLGTMGVYGTPNIDIEEGFIDITHKGRKDNLPFPKQPFSFYHLSKVHDSNNILFACRVWGLKATDLNQGLVYGIETDETIMNEDFKTSFHYDSVFGTVLNRFAVQSVVGFPLTIYGNGSQTRGCLNIKDTIQCVELALNNPPEQGKYEVYNQFTESFSIIQFADFVEKAAKNFDIKVNIEKIKNPRVEKEDHYYNPTHTKLLDLGLKPNLLTVDMVSEMLKRILESKNDIDQNLILPSISWKQK